LQTIGSKAFKLGYSGLRRYRKPLSSPSVSQFISIFRRFRSVHFFMLCGSPLRVHPYFSRAKNLKS